MSLKDIIIQKIQQRGPINFHDFMEMALYYPELGYYSSGREKIGKKGDFYTSSNLTSAFGAMIAKQLEEMWGILGEQPFTIVEYGAGTGLLCRDILGYLKNNRKLFDQLSYCIIEKGDALRKLQQEYLTEKVSWYNDISEIGQINGCVLSNELLDNFSVHRVVMTDRLMEVFVDYRNEFSECLKPASPAVVNYFEELGVDLPNGYRTEASLEVIHWINEISAALGKGFLLTIDYGYSSHELYRPSRSSGTLMCYNKHELNDNPYQDIGQQDITAHVNFSALCHWGFKNGLICCGLTNQGQFLLSLGFRDHLIRTAEPGKNMIEAARKASIITHTLLMDMGTKFKVLIQKKGLPNQWTPLQGLSGN